MLTIEYIGLIIIFTAYAFVQTAWVAALLYILDHMLFAMAIAIKSYFQKIADPADIASTSGVAFTVNHIAAVVIPASFRYRLAVFTLTGVSGRNRHGGDFVAVVTPGALSTRTGNEIKCLAARW